MNLRSSKHWIGVIGVLLAGACLTGAQNGLTWHSFKPDKTPSVQKVMVMGKELRYYPLERGQEILVTVEGPTTLKVLSRVDFGRQTKGEKRYYLRYEHLGGKKGRFRRSAGVSATAVLTDDPNHHLGSSRSAFLKVPPGKQTYRFYVGNKASYRLYLRVYNRTAVVEAKSQYVALAPARFSRAVDLVIKEEQVTYYRAGTQDSLKLSVIGPTTIQVLTRLEFDPTMVSGQKFRVRVFENGTEKQIFALRSKLSEIAEYREASDKKVGQAAKFFIEVPRGKHEYTFEIVDDGRSALMRFLLPRKDIANNL
ncbi:MAG: hypothetical protein C4524_09205 [Candidatus Zixiibacteriota bacterium]|nr:MAG: hypothetical protein C4524_09205 [candidate division Zixibacteria bacterium]